MNSNRSAVKIGIASFVGGSMAERLARQLPSQASSVLTLSWKLGKDRITSPWMDSRSAPPNGASQSWAAANGLAASISGPYERGREEILGRLQRKDETKAFFFAVPRLSADERGCRIVLLR